MTSSESLIKRTVRAAPDLRAAKEQQIKTVLTSLANEIEKNVQSLIRANRKDLAKQNPDNEKNDRLLLNEERIQNIARAIRRISKLPNPSGKILEQKKLKNGLLLKKQTVPLGVVGAIFESRPNVTFDISALCLRSRNACVLKGSRDAEHTNKTAVSLIKKVLEREKINPDCVTLLPSSRDSADALMKASGLVDVLIPRGSNELIQFVRNNSVVPVIETGAGVCHVYIQKDADLDKAVNIAVNAKTSRPSVCNAADTFLVDRSIAKKFFTRLAPLFENYRVEIFANPESYLLMKNYPFLKKAKPKDFGREFLSLKCAVKTVSGIDEAMEHIQKYSTKHSEAIVSENKKFYTRFLEEVDAATVYANASTRFTDGEEFGLGAEIGISTQKLHARGPFALEKLVTEKWIIMGDGQTR
ncbi:MAG: glutamate-5-semialdehyde dehydrogenase [Flavisolibacter sp.]